MRRHFTKVALVALVAVAALPVWAGSGVAGQDPSRQQEVEQRVQAEIAKAMEELRAELAQMKEELAALSEERARQLRTIASRVEVSEVDRERAREMARQAREMAQQATEHLRYSFNVEPFAGRLMALHRSGGAYGEAVIDHAEDIGLDETQQEQIHGIQREHRRASIARGADIEVAEMDLEALDEDPDADISGVRSVLETLAALRIDGQIADRELRRDVRQVLTAEQREQFDELWGRQAFPRSIAISRRR